MIEPTLTPLEIAIASHRWQVHLDRAFDLSIPMRFDGAQPIFFGAASASERPLASGSFIGDVRRGGSCNCSTYVLTPHCNGTHTECVGHVTKERINIRDTIIPPLVPTLLISVTPDPATAVRERSDPLPRPGDWLITRAALESAVAQFDSSGCTAIVVRTLPNGEDKLQHNYDANPAPYFSLEAIQWLVHTGIEHLVVDLPSIDRAQDEGRLAGHRAFWGLPSRSTSAAEATRADATITELAFIDNEVPDGYYVLNLQTAPFVADAAPCRPILLLRTRL